MRYEGEKCPVCQNEFAPGDDIVVCPDCGTPHHRACWKVENVCANSQHHAADFSWQPAAVQPEESGADEAKDETKIEIEVVCPDCGEVSPAGTKRCPNCGAIIIMPVIAQVFSAPESVEKFFSPDDMKPEFGSASAAEMAAFIGVNANRYIPRFRRFARGKKLSWNWGAFFLSPYWFFFRKLYKAGAVFITLWLAVTLLMTPVLTASLERIGAAQDTYISAVENVTDTAAITAAQTEMLEKVNNEKTPMLIYSGIMLLLMAASALSANRLIYNDAVKKIAAVQAVRGVEEGAKRLLLISRGGVALIPALLSILGYRLVLYLSNLF